MIKATGEKRPRRRFSAEHRRKQIADATITCLAQRAPAEWTLRQVSRDLGIAPSLVTHFFGTWNDLLVIVYRTLTERFLTNVTALEGRDLDRRGRLAAIIDLYLGDEAEREAESGAYIALWAFSRTEPRLRAEMDRFSVATVDLIAAPLEAYAHERGYEGDLAQVSQTVFILLEGLWYEMAVNPDFISQGEARQQVWAYIDGMLP